jgi:hypothetical protein
MRGGEWVTQKEKRQLATNAREQARAEKRQLTIEWADKFWLAQNHPCDDSVLAWLSEHRSEASKIGASRWNLETLPMLVTQPNCDYSWAARGRWLGSELLEDQLTESVRGADLEDSSTLL